MTTVRSGHHTIIENMSDTRMTEVITGETYGHTMTMTDPTRFMDIGREIQAGMMGEVRNERDTT